MAAALFFALASTIKRPGESREAPPAAGASFDA
jgi:hypothetical protein